MATWTALEDINFNNCTEISDHAWSTVDSGVWSQLRTHLGVPEAYIQSARRSSAAGAEKAHSIDSQLLTLGMSVGVCKVSGLPTALADRIQVLRALSTSTTLEEVDFHFAGCSDVGDDWPIIGNANWKELRKASFSVCFMLSGKGAKDVLKALCTSTALEYIDFGRRHAISDDDWSTVGSGVWPQLKGDCRGVPKEVVARARGSE
eukprot:TRINITY_DN6402_c0_g1_i1.p1 TRINITY_DN6402_c0_g1~~TRINITY_DN6402_c0_g1_i1.p1  ORF type:complete len:205 (+),score=33.09 TRINITY_DN6402_c0_g1_i1:320-934(+)